MRAPTAFRAAARAARPGPTSAFLGWRLWQGGEFYFNPELAQGFGLNSTLGLAGFSNGEAQKGGAPYPKYRPQRYVFRQTFGLGGEQEDVADGADAARGQARHRPHHGARSAVSRSAIISTATPTPRIPASTS